MIKSKLDEIAYSDMSFMYPQLIKWKLKGPKRVEKIG